IGMVCLFSVTVAVVLLTLPYPLTGILCDDQTVRRLASRFMIFGALFQIFDVVALVYRAALRGAGDNTWVAAISLVYAAVFLVGGGMAMGFLLPHWKGYGPWTAATVFVIILAVTTWSRFVFGPWEHIDLMSDSESHASPA
ncbi:MAG: MATE family efflux transporter, partial [Pirellulaceae bacterium]|nr:MATE family efflux transporter [Pirellulaceae bacterium]